MPNSRMRSHATQRRRNTSAATEVRSAQAPLNYPRVTYPELIVPARRYHRGMFDAADAPDPDRVYLNYLETCRRLGIEPVPREPALGLIVEWTEVLTGRPDPIESRSLDSPPRLRLRRPSSSAPDRVRKNSLRICRRLPGVACVRPVRATECGPATLAARQCRIRDFSRSIASSASCNPCTRKATSDSGEPSAARGAGRAS